MQNKLGIQTVNKIGKQINKLVLEFLLTFSSFLVYSDRNIFYLYDVILVFWSFQEWIIT